MRFCQISEKFELAASNMLYRQCAQEAACLNRASYLVLIFANAILAFQDVK